MILAHEPLKPPAVHAGLRQRAPDTVWREHRADGPAVLHRLAPGLGGQGLRGTLLELLEQAQRVVGYAALGRALGAPALVQFERGRSGRT